MPYIQLTQGMRTRVDAEDLNQLQQYSWRAEYNSQRGSWRVKRSEWDARRKFRTFYMHREILGLKSGDGKQVDHINHDGLDNRRSNLRICTRSENMGNSRKHRDSRSKYKGVFPYQTCPKCNYVYHWVAQIHVAGRPKHLGVFATEDQAARVYDKNARKVFGKFACVNFPVKGEQSATRI